MIIEEQRRPRYWLALCLLLLTIWTTAAAGSRMVFNFDHNLPPFRFDYDGFALFDSFFNPHALYTGLSFALPLILILLAHELGHYCACLYYQLDATLPYFLPVPTFIGTFGAFIRIRSIIYSRTVLFDVGVAGPIAGVVVLLPFLFFGTWLSHVAPGVATSGDLVFGTPLLIRFFEGIFFPGIPPDDIYLHPMARAAWVGIFATALNLLPIGQLDGGHIVYSLTGAWAKKISLVAIATLIPLGYFYPPWWGWAVVLYFFGRRHPQIFDESPLDRRRRLVAAVALLIFVLCFMTVPLRY
ncbi:site-2 protease family protein [Bryobacter aggregatus]|uniref:site-2 protease family protein n=1 Tax=Bryobacter aggregatus TaxID=360054 RepID=UPI0006904753|nr:site-2 protease family protein [Bryobacter aggregatus]